MLSYDDQQRFTVKNQHTKLQLVDIFSDIYTGILTATAAIYMVTSLKDKESGLRHMMDFGGVKPLSYYSATIIADYVIFMAATFIFLLFVMIFEVGYLYHHIW